MNYKIVVEKGNKKAIIQENYNKKSVQEGIAEVYLKLYRKHNKK